MDLRDYQREFVENAYAELSGKVRSTLGVLPCGCGKTVSFSHLTRRWLEEHPETRALIIAHREELIFQAGDKYEAVTGEIPDVEMAERRASRHGLLSESSVVVSSVQTQNAGRKCPQCEESRLKCADCGGEGCIACDGGSCTVCLDGMLRRMQRFDPDEFSLLIIDEAHHACAASYRRLIDYYGRNPDLRILGVTATPDRKDEKALGQVFESVAFEYGVVDAITDGWLVPIQQEWVTCENLDFSKVRAAGGDLNNADLEQVMVEEKALHEVTTPTIEIAGGRPTLVFAASVSHAELMAEIFNRHKDQSAICITGSTPPEKRREWLAEYAGGKYQFLVGCSVFLEGFDEPRIEVVAMARPTRSRALYAQAIGRGTRPIDPPTQATADERRAAIAAGPKPSLLVLDFVGNSGRHKLISTADILGGKYTDDVVERAVKKSQGESQETGEPSDMLESLAEAEREIRDEEARRKREKIKAEAKYRRQTVNPFDVFDLTPMREPGWHKGKKPSERMLENLRRNGVEDPEKLSFHQAHQIIGEIFRRRDQGLCSYKQARLLGRFGEDTDIGFQAAHDRIDAIKKNGWKPLK